MPIKSQTTKIIFLSLFLFFLTIKTSQVTTDSAEWEIIILPRFVFDLGAFAVPLAATALFAYLTTNFRGTGFRFSLIPTATVFTGILCYYHFRSFQVGSGGVNNILAIGVSVLVLLSFSLDREVNSDTIIKSLIYALGGFTLVSFSIYILGYGFPITGSGRRFFGLTPHPNFQGAYSALAFAIFTTIASWNLLNINRNLRAIFWGMSSLSAFLVVISGSRTAMGLVVIAILFGPRLQHKIYTVVLLLFLFLTMGATVLVFPDSAMSLAISRIQDAPLDNRSEVWSLLIDDFMDYPFLGAGDRSGVSGNGYLTAFGGTGFLFGFLFLICIASALIKCIKLIFLKSSKLHIDANFIFAILLLQIFAASFFEGYMFDKFGLVQVATILFLTQLGSRARFSIRTKTQGIS